MNYLYPLLCTCFSNRWQKIFNQKLTLSETTILYGWHKESNNWEVRNNCSIVTKYNVFATGVRNGVLNFDSFLLRLNNKIDILCTIALAKHWPNDLKYVNASAIPIIHIPLSHTVLL